MAQCKWCEKKGFFLKVSNDGLCNVCSYIIKTEADSVVRVVMESVDIINNSYNPSTISSRANVVAQKLSYLKKYENKGISVFNIPIPEFISDTFDEANERIISLFYNEYFKGVNKIKTLKFENAKHKALEKFNAKSVEFKELLLPEAKNIELCSFAIDNAFQNGKLEELIKIKKKVMGKELDQYDLDFEVDIIIIPAKDSCDSCKELSKMKFTLDQAKKELPLPHAKCTHDYGCRCCYAAEPKESFLDQFNE
jgi:hypothetical protein